MAPTDVELVRSALRGSQDAYRDLVVRFERPIFGLVLRMVRDRSVAEELAQEVFLKAFQALDSFDQKRKFSSWLFKIAHNRAIDHLRRARHEMVPLETEEEGLDPIATVAAPDGESPEAATVRGGLMAAFEEALGELRPQYREVLLLRFREGLSYEEISEVCELPMGTVKTHIHRARKALAQALEEAGWERGE